MTEASLPRDALHDGVVHRLSGLDGHRGVGHVVYDAVTVHVDEGHGRRLAVHDHRLERDEGHGRGRVHGDGDVHSDVLLASVRAEFPDVEDEDAALVEWHCRHRVGTGGLCLGDGLRDIDSCGAVCRTAVHEGADDGQYADDDEGEGEFVRIDCTLIHWQVSVAYVSRFYRKIQYRALRARYWFGG